MIQKVIETVYVDGQYYAANSLRKRSIKVRPVESVLTEYIPHRPFEKHVGRNIDITV